MAQAPQSDVSGLFIRELREFILPTFWCDHIERNELCDAVASKDYASVLQFYERQVDAAKTALLFPNQLPNSNAALDVCYMAADSHVMMQCWTRLISDIAHVAAHIKLSLNEVGSTQDHLSRTNRRRLVCQIVLAMRLMLLARLYRERTDNNIVAIRLAKEAMSGERATFPRARVMRRKLTSAIAQYDRQIRKWHVRRSLPTGWKDGSDAYTYDQWSQGFRSTVPGEEGWSSFPRLLSRELLYYRSRSSLRQRLDELPLSFLSLGEGSWWARCILFPIRILQGILGVVSQLALIVFLFLFMVTCGFGFKPRRVAISVGCAPLLFSSAYIIDDTIVGRCASVTWRLAANSLYSAIANFTTMGGAPTSCGPYTGVFVSVETIAGYFLLSILAAMFFVWLTDR